jgi:hypothetical protein
MDLGEHYSIQEEDMGNGVCIHLWIWFLCHGNIIPLRFDQLHMGGPSSDS